MCSTPVIHRPAATWLEPEAAVGHGTEAAQIEVPLELLHGQFVLRDRIQEDLEVLLALATTDQLTCALGPDDVHGEDARRVVRRLLHVEGLHRLGVVRDDQRLVVLGREELLVRRAEVVALDEVDVGVLEEELRGVVVGDAGEPALHGLELRDVALEHLQFGPAPLEHLATTETIMSSASWITSSSSA